MPGAVKEASSAGGRPGGSPSSKGKKGRSGIRGEEGVIPREVLFAPARAVQVRYGDGMIIRAGGGEEAIRTPFGPVSVEED
jgi:hypothetical protein